MKLQEKRGNFYIYTLKITEINQQKVAPECSRSNTKFAVRLQAESMLINSAPHMGLQVVGWKHNQSVRGVLQKAESCGRLLVNTCSCVGVTSRRNTAGCVDGLCTLLDLCVMFLLFIHKHAHKKGGEFYSFY